MTRRIVGFTVTTNRYSPVVCRKDDCRERAGQLASVLFNDEAEGIACSYCGTVLA